MTEGQIIQSAVAWLLSTAFLRICEDNELVSDVFPLRLRRAPRPAKERQQHYFEQPDDASETDREWVEEGLNALAKASPVAAGLFDRDHNPMWKLTPSMDSRLSRAHRVCY